MHGASLEAKKGNAREGLEQGEKESKVRRTSDCEIKGKEE